VSVSWPAAHAAKKKTSAPATTPHSHTIAIRTPLTAGRARIRTPLATRTTPAFTTSALPTHLLCAYQMLPCPTSPGLDTGIYAVCLLQMSQPTTAASRRSRKCERRSEDAVVTRSSSLDSLAICSQVDACLSIGHSVAAASNTLPCSEIQLHAIASGERSSLTEALCPQGHPVTDDEAFCSVCGYEKVPAEEIATDLGESEMRRALRLDPQALPVEDEFAGASMFAMLLYFAAFVALLLGMVVLHEYVTIIRSRGVDRLETIWIIVIVSLTLVTVALLSFCGYVIDMLRELAFRSRRERRADAGGSAPRTA
jgi:hypothetical protein